jgi:hypothetical protein
MDIALTGSAARVPTTELLVCTYTFLPNVPALGGAAEVWEPIPEMIVPQPLASGATDAYYVQRNGTTLVEVHIKTRHAGIFAVFQTRQIARR